MENEVGILVEPRWGTNQPGHYQNNYGNAILK